MHDLLNPTSSKGVERIGVKTAQVLASGA